jgi:hypothetical protein
MRGSRPTALPGKERLMATVRLFDDELNETKLPHVCMRCGAPSALFLTRRFSWGPEWVMVLLIAGVLASGPLFLVALVLIPILLRTKRVPIPLCLRHRNHWRPLKVLLYGGLSVLAVLMVVGIGVLLTSEGRDDPRNHLAWWSCGGAFLVMLGILVPGAVLQTRTIRAVEITPDSITLTYVGKPFVQALDEQAVQQAPRNRPKHSEREPGREQIERRREEDERDS